jgi:hypothetical protein
LALVLALLLIELHLTLLHFSLCALHLRQALVGLLFSLIFYLYALFTAFKKLFLTDNLRFSAGFLNDSFCTVTACHVLHGDCGQTAYRQRHHGNSQIK